MKLKLPLLISLILGGAIAVSCSTKTQSNNPLGNLPSMYEKFSVEQSQIDEQTKAQAEVLNREKKTEEFFDLAGEYEKQRKERNEIFNATIATEIAILGGRDVELSYSQPLENSTELFYQIDRATIGVGTKYPELWLTINAKQDMTIDSYEGSTKVVYYQLVTKQDRVIQQGELRPIKDMSEIQTFTAGQSLLHPDKGVIAPRLRKLHKEFADFASIKMVTKAEYDQHQPAKKGRPHQETV